MKNKTKNSYPRIFLRTLLLAVVMMCGVSYAKADMPDPNSAIRCGNTSTPRTMYSTYQSLISNNVLVRAWTFDPFSAVLERAFKEAYFDSSGNYLDNDPLWVHPYIKVAHQSYCYATGWNIGQWEEFDGVTNKFLINSTDGYDNHMTSYIMFELMATNSKDGKTYISLVKYELRHTTRADGKIENSLIPQDKTIAVGQPFNPTATSTADSDGEITYSGPYTDYACTQASSKYDTPSDGTKRSNATGTYYFKATQAATDAFADASTVVTITVTNLNSNSLTAKDITTYVNTSVSLDVTSVATMPRNENNITLSVYNNASCTTLATSGTDYSREQQPSQTIATSSTQKWTYTFKKPGVYYVKATQSDDTSHGVAGATTIFKVTVNKKDATVQKVSTVNSTIYRSRPDNLNVSTLFTSSGGGSLSYAIYAASGNTVALNGTTLPESMEKGTYYIVCSQAETTEYSYGSEYITLKIVGVAEKKVVYQPNSGQGELTYTIQDVMTWYDTEIPHTSSYRLIFTGIGTQEISVDGATVSVTPNDLGDTKRNVTLSSISITWPSTKSTNYYSDDTSTTFGDLYSTSSEHVYKYQNTFETTGGFDKLLANVTISPYDPSGFWPVPSNFSQQGGTDIADDIESCPLTLGGSGTYGTTAKNCEDADYKSPSTNVFSYTTSSTAAAAEITDLIPTSGTYYKFAPQYDNMYLTVGIYLPKRNKIMIIDSYGDTHTSRTDLGSGLEGWRDINGTVTLEVQKGHSYYFYSPDTALQIFGYEYSKAE